MFKDGDDDLSDLTSSEQSQLNDWYDNLSSKYDKVGNIIREVSQSWVKVFMTHIYDSSIFRTRSQSEESETFNLLKTFKLLLEKLITSDLLTFLKSAAFQ